MSCCADIGTLPVVLQTAETQRVCLSCQGPSQPVTLRTLRLMLKPEFFDQVGESQYRFCASPACPVVYFSRECCFTSDALRIRVGLKEKDGLIPLCYCFGFNEQDLQAEIQGKGHTTIPQRISALTKERMCACEECNPSGACCLGEVTKAVKRLMKEHHETKANNR